ncbi:MAG: phage baseplate protein [Chloroflexia bacterium]
MRALSAAALLDVWDQGMSVPPARRALSLLAAAEPGAAPTDLAELPVGERDSRLLTLREWTFGPHLAGRAECPECGMALDLSFEVNDIRASPETEPAESFVVEAEGYTVEFRLPNSRDLLALDGLLDVEGARQVLLADCILSIRHPESAEPRAPLPDAVVAAIVGSMVDADPQADVLLALTCPLCKNGWRESFDIVSFFWDELDAWAYRMMREVHSLAAAYGWGEAEILALSPRRRQFYLELVSG